MEAVEQHNDAFSSHLKHHVIGIQAVEYTAIKKIPTAQKVDISEKNWNQRFNIAEISELTTVDERKSRSKKKELFAKLIQVRKWCSKLLLCNYNLVCNFSEGNSNQKFDLQKNKVRNSLFGKRNPFKNVVQML